MIIKQANLLDHINSLSDSINKLYDIYETIPNLVKFYLSIHNSKWLNL